MSEVKMEPLLSSKVNRYFAVVLLLLSSVVVGTVKAQVSSKTISTVESAMADELARSHADLHLPGLIDPFFIAYTVADQQSLEISASNGSLLKNDDNHVRQESVRLLVNNYQFNDENFTDNTGFFSFSTAPDNSLPLDDDYLGIRRALWLSTDDLFKDANENFTKKKAALEHKQLAADMKDLPDFAKAPAIHVEVAPVTLHYNRGQLVALVKEASAIFNSFPQIEASNVKLTISNAYEWMQNTEGTKVRKPVTFCKISAQASLQATADGEPLSLNWDAVGSTPSELPTRDAVLDAVRNLAKNLVALGTAPILDKEYTGPVLFVNEAASDYLAENLISRLTAKREDIFGDDVSAIFSSGKRASLKDKLDTRIVPKSVSITDMTQVEGRSGDDYLGHYAFDAEGVVPTPNLALVTNGILKTLYMTRTPTKEVREPNGHARSFAGALPGVSQSAAAPGVVEYRDTKAVALNAMKKDLFVRAKDDGYNFALVVHEIQDATPTAGMDLNLSDMIANGKQVIPALVYKVFPNGKEELLRDVQISLPTIRDFREMIASKETSTRNMLISGGDGGLFSFSAKVPATLIGPDAILCPELDVHKKQPSAYPTLPVVARP